MWSALGGTTGLGFILALHVVPLASVIALAMLSAAFLLLLGWYLIVNLRDLCDLYRPIREDSGGASGDYMVRLLKGHP